MHQRQMLLKWGGFLALLLAVGCATHPAPPISPEAPASAEAPLAAFPEEKASPIPIEVEMAPAGLVLLPQPKNLTWKGAVRGLAPGPVEIDGFEGEGSSRADYVRAFLREVLDTAFVDSGAAGEQKPGGMQTSLDLVSVRPRAVLAITPQTVPQPEGYRLVIRPEGITVQAHDLAGVFHAAETLAQIRRQAPALGGIPLVEITDAPDFLHRGLMLDISRDKVPEMETLYGLVDQMAEWKLNQLQLYTEHAFAYPGHYEVWKDASPMTPAQIRALDRYCSDRCIELVPNQNSFGHMERWLAHERYQSLAEKPGCSELCATDPQTIIFLKGLYADLLPNFSSGMVNVGCDETWNLGKGRSKEAVQLRGKGRVYLDYLLAIRQTVARHGKRMQFWGDIIMRHPELIPELPQDMIALEWGYEADHPFREHGKRFAEAGIPYYVVPGTSTWNSLAGRTQNAIANLRNAAVDGLANGAQGMLITDWGDNGHWQFLPVSYLPFAYGAALAWGVEANEGLNIPRALDAHIFRDRARIMGRLVYELGNAYRQTGMELSNSTAFYELLLSAQEEPISGRRYRGLTTKNLEATIAYIDRTMNPLENARMDRPDADVIRAELRCTAALMRLACRFGIARLENGGAPASKLPSGPRAMLADEMAALIPQYRQLWLTRNRSGGLQQSSGRFEDLVRLLRNGGAGNGS